MTTCHASSIVFDGRNLAGLDLDRVAADATRDPWVRNASVKRVLPDTLRVSVEERTPAALAVVNGLVHVVDGTGFVMGPAGPGLAFDLPVLTGFDGLRGDDLSRALAESVDRLAALRRASPGFAAGVSSLDRSSPDRLAVETAAVIAATPRTTRNHTSSWANPENSSASPTTPDTVSASGANVAGASRSWPAWRRDAPTTSSRSAR